MLRKKKSHATKTNHPTNQKQNQSKNEYSDERISPERKTYHKKIQEKKPNIKHEIYIRNYNLGREITISPKKFRDLGLHSPNVHKGEKIVTSQSILEQI